MHKRLSASEVHDLLHAKLDSLLQECDTVADNAEHGRTVHDLDDFHLIAGRKFMQEVYQHKLQEPACGICLANTRTFRVCTGTA